MRILVQNKYTCTKAFNFKDTVYNLRYWLYNAYSRVKKTIAFQHTYYRWYVLYGGEGTPSVAQYIMMHTGHYDES